MSILSLAPFVSGYIPVSMLAYRIKAKSSYLRFCIGFLANQYLFWLQARTSPPPKESPVAMMLHFFWRHIAVVGFYGGVEYYNRHNIKNYWEVILASLIPGQTYFHQRTGADDDAKDDDDDDNNQGSVVPAETISQTRRLIAKEWGWYLANFCAFFGFAKLLKQPKVSKAIENNPVLHACAHTLVLGMSLPVATMVSHVASLFVHTKARVEHFYGYILNAKSPRDFWKRQSRPLTEYYRYGVYKPLGGRKNPIVATLAIFAINGWIHLGYSQMMFGPHSKERMAVVRQETAKTFALMGAAVAGEILMEESPYWGKYKGTVYWNVFWKAVLLGSMVYTVHRIGDNILFADLGSMLKDI